MNDMLNSYSPFKYFNFSTELTAKEEFLKEEIDSLVETLTRKQQELSILQKKITLEYLSSCDKEFSCGDVINNLATGKTYFIAKTSPLELW